MSADTMPRGGAAGGVLFAIGLAIGIGALGLVIPRSEPPLIATRLAEFDAERDGIDTLFFGSSRLFRGFDPSVFDAVTTALGQIGIVSNTALLGLDGLAGVDTVTSTQVRLNSSLCQSIVDTYVAGITYDSLGTVTGNLDGC